MFTLRPVRRQEREARSGLGEEVHGPGRDQTVRLRHRAQRRLVSRLIDGSFSPARKRPPPVTGVFFQTQ